MSTWNKPLPHPTATSQPYWDGLRCGEVRLQQCDDCHAWIFFPREHCPSCASHRLTWRRVSGEGEVYTYTVARVPTLPEFTDEMPQLLAVVRLDEGPHINTTLVGVSAEAVQVGMRVRPVFDHRPGEVSLLRFTPLGSTHPSTLQPDEPQRAEQSSGAAPAQANAQADAQLRAVSCKDMPAMQSLVSEEWSGWSNEFTVTQEIINQFAELSGDDYWIHTDPVRARAESPFGTTIAHGMLVHSLASRLKLPLSFRITDSHNMVNYGSDRLRFSSPVPSGCRIHARSRVKAVQAVKSGVQMTMEIAIHVVGNDRPSVLNEQVILYM